MSHRSPVRSTLAKACCLTDGSIVHHGFCPLNSPRDHLHRSPSFPLLDEAPSQVLEQRKPFLSFGFKISNQLVYISDASHIPEESWNVITPKTSGHVPVCVLDCLQLEPHTSHFCLAQSVSVARRICATRTYLTGFCHAATHEEYVSMGEIVGGALKDHGEMAALNAKGFSVEKGDAIWIRPAHDGLRVTVDDGVVWDETYLNQSFQGKVSWRGWHVYLKSLLSWKRLATLLF